ncbi:histamine H3 receptor-like [Xenopus tropicalis]|uniref:Muscarinic acetylcholine receptor n=1 Tax=Xenopus tropicalis TaxID=8364 RepID=A0A8J1JRD8_XENTR|nr:histamine H3 receptor-like [Xenopus tropicalis]
MNFNATAGNFSIIRVNAGLEMQLSKGIAILITVLTSCLISLTVLGNIFVILAFIVDKRLRNQTEFVLLNLAVCDFLIGAFTSPMYLQYFLTGKWMFGRFLCKLWLTVDYTVCTASVFNIVLISYDRFLSVTKAVLYRSLQNKRSHTVVSIASVWVFSFLLYGPVILSWKNDVIDSSDPVTTCVPGFIGIWYIRFGTSCIDFALPLISISFFNLSIYCSIKKRGRKKRQKSMLQNSKGKENDGNLHIISTNSVLFSAQLHVMENFGTEKRLAVSLRHCFPYRKPSSFTHNEATLQHRNNSQVNLSRDEKIARSLSILVCTFGICWAPYTFLASIRVACSASAFPQATGTIPDERESEKKRNNGPAKPELFPEYLAVYCQAPV